MPSVVDAAINAERFGADGITVHPRPDERHARYADVRDLTKVVTTEFNIEELSEQELHSFGIRSQTYSGNIGS